MKRKPVDCRISPDPDKPKRWRIEVADGKRFRVAIRGVENGKWLDQQVAGLRAKGKVVEDLR